MSTHTGIGLKQAIATQEGTPARPVMARWSGPVALALIVALLAAMVWGAALSYYGTFHRGWDAQLYYAHLRSAVIDGDLDATNEVRSLMPGKEVFVAGKPWGGLPVTADGRVVNIYTVGSPLLGVPGFMAGHAIALGWGYPPDGYSRPYEYAVTLWYALLVAAGCGLLASAMRPWVTQRAAWIAVLALFLGTNLTYYTGVLPTMNHGASFFLVSTLLWLALRLYQRPDAAGLWRVVAAVTFLIVLVRPTDVVMLVVLGPAAWRVIRTGWRPSLSYGVPVLLAIFAAAATQVLVWRVVFGRWVFNAYSEWAHGAGFDFLNPMLVDLLISGRGGGWLYHPLFAVCFLGLVLACCRGPRGDRRVWVALIAGVVLHLGVYSCWVSWDSGDSFGNRIFINSAPLGAVGLAWLIDRARRPVAVSLWIAALALAIASNGLLMVGYIHKTLPPRAEANVYSLAKAQWQTLRGFVEPSRQTP